MFRIYLGPGKLASGKRHHDPPTALHYGLASVGAAPLEDCNEHLVVARVDDPPWPRS